jgi:capsular polysaccharide biosynthesis protein
VKWLKNVAWWQWLAMAGLLVGLLAGGYLGNRMSNALYTSAAQVLMTGQGDPTQPDTAYTSNQYVNQRMTTYAQIASSAQVTAPAAQALGTDPATLTNEITATVAGDTTVLTLEVTGVTPDAARRNAVAVTQSFINAITKLETNPGGAARVVVNVITDPTMPAERSVPPLWLMVLGGAAAGLVLGSIAALLLRWLYPHRFQIKFRTAAVGNSAENTSQMPPVAQPTQKPWAS